MKLLHRLSRWLRPSGPDSPARPQSGAPPNELFKLLGHQLRTPLGAIAAAVEVMESAEPGSADALEARAVIGRQTQHLLRIVNELPDIERRIASGVPAGREAGQACSESPVMHDDGKLPPSRRRKVLVVEGNDSVLAALQSQLEMEGHTVSTAADGVEGLVRLLKLRPEVSIVDVGVAGLTGFELARHARAAGYAGRMIALTAQGGNRNPREALVAGFDAYLVEPVDRQQLRSSVSADAGELMFVTAQLDATAE
jgi:CheY-like chemotaxis protein